MIILIMIKNTCQRIDHFKVRAINRIMVFSQPNFTDTIQQSK